MELQNLSVRRNLHGHLSLVLMKYIFSAVATEPHNMRLNYVQEHHLPFRIIFTPIGGRLDQVTCQPIGCDWKSREPLLSQSFKSHCGSAILSSLCHEKGLSREGAASSAWIPEWRCRAEPLLTCSQRVLWDTQRNKPLLCPREILCWFVRVAWPSESCRHTHPVHQAVQCVFIEDLCD